MYNYSLTLFIIIMYNFFELKNKLKRKKYNNELYNGLNI